MSPYKLLFLAVTAAATLGGCTLSTVSHDDRHDLNSGVAYTPAYGQPPYQTSGVYNPAPGQVYQQPANTPLAGRVPNTGQWQWGTTPDGYRTRIWIPDNSWKQNSPQAAYEPPANQPPRYNELYRAARGRYDTIRYPDGRLEHEWRAEEPSTPLQGYWQIVQAPGGAQRVWVSSTEGTANER